MRRSSLGCCTAVRLLCEGDAVRGMRRQRRDGGRLAEAHLLTQERHVREPRHKGAAKLSNDSASDLVGGRDRGEVHLEHLVASESAPRATKAMSTRQPTNRATANASHLRTERHRCE